MKEIEVKFKLKNEKAVTNKLRGFGCIFSEPVKQIDTVYTRMIGNLEIYLKNDHFVRIREKDSGQFIFTVKVPKALRENLVKKEYETEVKNKDELELSLFVMGYKISNKVIKVRRTTKFKDYEICLDEVEGLGSFIEVEKIMQDEDEHTDILKELQTFVVSLDVSPEDEIKKGYDILILEKVENK